MLVIVGLAVNAFFFFWWGVRWIAQWFVMNQPAPLSIFVLSGASGVVMAFFICISISSRKASSIFLAKAVLIFSSTIIAAHCITIIGASGAPINMIILEDFRLLFQLGTWICATYFLLISLDSKQKRKDLSLSFRSNWMLLQSIFVLGYASTLMAISVMGGMLGNSGPFMTMPGTPGAALGITSSVMTFIVGAIIGAFAISLRMGTMSNMSHAPLVLTCAFCVVAFVFQIAQALLPVVSAIDTGMPSVQLPTPFLQFLAGIMFFQWYPSFYANVCFVVAVATFVNGKDESIEMK